MQGLLTDAFVTSLVAGAVIAGMPLLLAGLGETISEKAGILNIGLEGMMLFGAYTGFVVALFSASMWLGFAAGAAAGAVLGGLMALLCVRLGMNQIVIGIALTLGAEGITALLFLARFSRTYPRLPAAETVAIPYLVDLPVVGQSIFGQHLMVYVAIAMVALTSWVFRSTNVGLNLQAAGDRPLALDAAGVSVTATRTLAVVSTGALGGLGGAYLCLVGAGLFIPFMTNGAGFIGIVLAMLARGRPTWIVIGALVFGVSLSLTTVLQVANVNIPTDLVQMLPFAMVMLVLVIFGRKAYLPAALTLHYERGGR